RASLLPQRLQCLADSPGTYRTPDTLHLSLALGGEGVTTYFFKDVGVDGYGSLAESNPGAANMATGWTVAKLAAGNFSKVQYGTKKASGTFSTSDPMGTASAPTSANDDAFRSENTISGTFANANWTIGLAVRAVTASAQAGRAKVRLWRSANADGSGATQITSALLTGPTTAALSTTVTQTSTATFAPGATITLTNEYLFAQFEWEITTASGNNSSDAVIRSGEAPRVPSTFTPAPISGTLAVTETPDAAAFAGGPVIAAALATTEAADIAEFWAALPWSTPARSAA